MSAGIEESTFDIDSMFSNDAEATQAPGALVTILFKSTSLLASALAKSNPSPQNDPLTIYGLVIRHTPESGTIVVRLYDMHKPYNIQAQPMVLLQTSEIENIDFLAMILPNTTTDVLSQEFIQSRIEAAHKRRLNMSRVIQPGVTQYAQQLAMHLSRNIQDIHWASPTTIVIDQACIIAPFGVDNVWGWSLADKKRTTQNSQSHNYLISQIGLFQTKYRREFPNAKDVPDLSHSSLTQQRSGSSMSSDSLTYQPPPPPRTNRRDNDSTPSNSSYNNHRGGNREGTRENNRENNRENRDNTRIVFKDAAPPSHSAWGQASVLTTPATTTTASALQVLAASKGDSKADTKTTGEQKKAYPSVNTSSSPLGTSQTSTSPTSTTATTITSPSNATNGGNNTRPKDGKDNKGGKDGKDGRDGKDKDGRQKDDKRRDGEKNDKAEKNNKNEKNEKNDKNGEKTNANNKTNNNNNNNKAKSQVDEDGFRKQRR